MTEREKCIKKWFWIGAGHALLFHFLTAFTYDISFNIRLLISTAFIDAGFLVGMWRADRLEDRKGG